MALTDKVFHLLSGFAIVPPNVIGARAALGGLARMNQGGPLAAGEVSVPPSDTRLRVGLVVDDFPVISETFVINMAAGLLDRGHDVKVLAMRGTLAGTARTHEVVARYDLGRLVSRPIAASVLVGKTESKDAGGLPRRWGMGQRAAAFFSQVGMFMRQPRFDIVHCQFANLGLAIRRHRMLGTLRTRRLVVHVRGHDVTSFTTVHGEDVYRRLFGSADLVVANCRHFHNRALALGASPDRTRVIGSAIDCERFRPGPQREATDTIKLIAVGRLVEKKGFADAIRAVADFVRTEPKVSLEIVGEGSLRSELSALIEKLELTDRVRLVGALTQDELARRLAQADVIVAPSVTARSGDQDANVNTLKEAMAVGLPVIATRHGGIPELVEDGVTGYLVPERDPSALAAALRRLSAERPRWVEMGRQGRSRVKAEFDRPVVTDRLVAAYRMLLDQKEPAA